MVCTQAFPMSLPTPIMICTLTNKLLCVCSLAWVMMPRTKQQVLLRNSEASPTPVFLNYKNLWYVPNLFVYWQCYFNLDIYIPLFFQHIHVNIYLNFLIVFPHPCNSNGSPSCCSGFPLFMFFQTKLKASIQTLQGEVDRNSGSNVSIYIPVNNNI